MEYKNIIVKKEDKIVIITMNREKALNALNDETIGELQDFFRHAWMDDSIGCVVITGAGKGYSTIISFGSLNPPRAPSASIACADTKCRPGVKFKKGR